MLATGVRIGEALAVRWADVNFDSGSVAIDHTIVRFKDDGLRRKATKTATGERTLILRRPRWRCCGGGRQKPRRMLRQARGSDGFAWVASHAFRKTAATILDEAGLSARVIANQLGHARPRLTQDVYMTRNTG